MEANIPTPSSKAVMYWVIAFLIIVAVTVIAFDVYLYKTVKREAAQVVLYDGPSSIQGAEDRTVTVDGKQLFLYDTAVNFNRSWTRNPVLEKTPMGTFDFEGAVTIQVKVPGTTIEKVAIRPLSLGIKPKISSDTISFPLDKPAKLTIEVNEDPHRAIHLFANPLEINPPQMGDPKVHYFGPGVHKTGRIPVKSGETVYLSGGAVVYGCIKAEGLENIKIMGRGIISGSIFDRWEDGIVPMDLQNCRNVEVERITLLDPSAWTLNVYTCENVKIHNVKIVSARANSDGITVQSCTNLTAADCFVRSWDDSLVVKGYDSNTRGITFDHCIIWTDLAQSCEIGYETRANFIEDITFQNITILHNFHKPALSIHNADNAIVQNVHYRNIVVEDAQMGLGDGAGSNYLIDLLVDKSPIWSKAKTRGNIRDVYYENITVLGGNLPVSRMQGFDEKHTIENIHIKNLKIFGEEIRDIKEGKFYVNEYVKNITFESP
jgi:hypothetical protein